MLTVFLGFSFRPQDRDLVGDVGAVLESHDVRPVNGTALGGEALTPAIEELIDQSDGFVGLLTPRDRLDGGRFTTHPWVRDELNYARATRRPAIAMVHKDVELDAGAYQEHERIDYDPADPWPAFLKLSRTVGGWKRRSGRLVKIRLLPDALGRRIGGGDGGISCKCRLTQDGRSGEWIDARILREVGGTFVYVPNVQDESLVELEVSLGTESWSSPAVPQWLHVKLEKRRAT